MIHKHDFDLVLFNKIYQLYQLKKKNIHAGIIKDYFQIPDRLARMYFFMAENQELFTSTEESTNVLVIPDPHAPFTKSGYLNFCVETYYKYKCNDVIFLGDVIDNCYTSAWTSDPDGMSAKDETDAAIHILKDWYAAFPKAKVIKGNHDLRILRAAFQAGISNMWIKDFSDVLQVPGWDFVTEIIQDGVLYVHGDGQPGGINSAFNRMLLRGRSVVQGHWHTISYLRYNVSDVDINFAMQLGCGIDRHAYAAAYQKNNSRKPVINCGVVLNNGLEPHIVTMKLKKNK